MTCKINSLVMMSSLSLFSYTVHVTPYSYTHTHTLSISLSFSPAYQTTFNTRIVDVLSEWGSLYVLLKDGRLIRLDELDTKTKLETLFKKNLYDTAIR